ncbi:uncharacterized protein LACBIDRAFT_301509 [Laccaria bicolor S238N-H82]|uniref:Predicted protein n=1 Tax=Laccaria bicolor (strain S238N-H82 / ATCC MYA-4686) TaxID=486041 RepID=B0CNQ0_LACBS|nr:uncharacterized protein LACBIDRAFT_301509 [Laccaria bicolor S238N-H82]EDR15974.1 predicted protein [Laccaria bicolor S238N-H82]|eukprot:XP_001874182.1 predicted protein [Laccaria bicolor S238N-H82]
MPVPRWKIAIETAIAEYKNQTVFQLATLDPTLPTPHVRSHVFRSFLSSEFKPNLPLLISSTDIRTPKVTQLAAHPDAELAWWIEGVQQQFRISGKVHVVPAPGHILFRHFLSSTASDYEGSSGIAALKKEGFDWEAKRVEAFKSLGGKMKATWCRPVPGTRLEGGQEEAKRWPVSIEEPKEGATEEEKSNWEMALHNFALVVIDPAEVDFVELGVVPNRRTNFTRSKEGTWGEEELVP